MRFEDVFPPFSWSSYTYEISVQRDSGKDSRSQWNENLRGLERKSERESGGYIRGQERRGRRDEVSKRPTVGGVSFLNEAEILYTHGFYWKREDTEQLL